MDTGVLHRSRRPLDSGPDDQPARLSVAEREFMEAMEAYKQRSGRLFPTWSEVFEVLRSLGYRRPEPPDRCPRHPG
jgi:hypothetical protein